VQRISERHSLPSSPEDSAAIAHEAQLRVQSSMTTVVAEQIAQRTPPSSPEQLHMSGSMMRWRTMSSAIIVACSLVATSTTRAQGSARDSADRAERRAKFKTIEWLTGPSKGRLGTIAEIEVPAGCRLTQEKGAKTFLELTENIPSDEEVGLLLCSDRAMTGS
jgi:hypothetical protein